MIDDEMRRAILADIMAATKVREKQAWEFDLDDYMAQCPAIGRRRAYDILMKMVRRGELQSDFVNKAGHCVRVFWRPGDVEQGSGESGKQVEAG